MGLSFLSSPDPPPSTPSAPPRVLPRAGKRPPLISSPPGQVKNYMHAKQLPVASRPSVFQSPDEEEEEDYEQWLEIKGKVWRLPPTSITTLPALGAGSVVSGDSVNRSAASLQAELRSSGMRDSGERVLGGGGGRAADWLSPWELWEPLSTRGAGLQPEQGHSLHWTR